MKRISIKTILLVCILTVNITTLFTLSGILKKNTKQEKYSYNNSISISERDAIKYYEVKKGDLNKCEIIDGYICYSSSQFKEYVIDTSDIWNIFDEVDQGQILGSFDGSSVESSCNGRIVSVDEEAGKKKIKIYDYSQTEVEVSFSYSSYYSHDFSQDSFYFEIGNKKYDLSYKNVLYDETSYSSINVVFNIDNSNLFIKEGYQIEVKFVEEIFQGAFYIEDIMILEPGVELTLNYVENGTIILIGATTENPYFEVNKALISRSMVVKLNPLSENDIFKVLKRAVVQKEGLGEYNVKIEDKTLKKLSSIVNGDVRTALNALEIAVLTTNMDENGVINIDDETIKNCVQNRKAVFDKNGDSHYDNISAFIKSMRGSDPDATLLYLARALKGGEDPVFLARRIVIAASEDVGMANPNALVVATSCMQAVNMVGMPEARIILSQAAVYVATSKKSNATYLGINKALQDVETKDTGEIPMHIRNAPVDGMEALGYHQGYLYPHDFPGHYVEQQYMPDKMLGTKYYVKDENIE